MRLCLCAVLAAGSGLTAPYGLDVYRHLELLPQVNPLVFAHGFSSYERNGGNYDRGYFLYKSGSEYVMADVRGAGALTRLWTTGQNSALRLRVYLDGARMVDKTFLDFFDGVGAPYLAPLIVNDDVSSGGFVSYLPLTFSNSCRVTSTDASLYYNIQLQTYHDGTAIPHWQTNAPSADVRGIWNNAGTPVGIYTNTSFATNHFDLAPYAAVAVADIAGAHVLHGLRLRNPHLTYDGPRRVTDNGRAFISTNGFSRFVMQIATNNSGVQLTRRLDAGIGDQRARVVIDGSAVGEWYTPGAQQGFLDSDFPIPAAVTEGKSVITARIEFVSSGFDWNEFYYWAYSLTGAVATLTDELDVGTPASETAHAYLINNQSWSGTRTYEYTITNMPRNLAWSTGVWLCADWDVTITNAVRAPVGLFFCTPFGVQDVRTLLVGCLTTAMEYYCYAPMPFASQGLVWLTNTSAQTFSNLWCETRWSDLPGDPDTLGWFHATYHGDTMVSNPADYVFLDVQGCGALIGVAHWMRGPTFRGYLEGDERIYVDGARAPRVQGTGTEDYYNGGWYFNRGCFAVPSHGNPHHVALADEDWTACYRWHLADSIPFRSALRASMEHGWENNLDVTYASVAFWYGRPQSLLTHMDAFDIGDPASEAAHAFVTNGAADLYTLDAAFDGEDDQTRIVDSGRLTRGSYSFRIAVDPFADALLLRRQNDFAYTNQTAVVDVNGAAVGVWYQAGWNNTTNHADWAVTNRWCDDEFVVPRECYAGATAVVVTVSAASGSVWTAFRYDVFAVQPLVVPEPAAVLLLVLLLAGRRARRIARR
ncbi:MAG: DUF2961 domain-containing protein [bacterium]|nr:DUF2961 domain-containing protein [bacterium]